MFAPKRRADKVKRPRLRSLELEPLALMAELASLLGGASALGAPMDAKAKKSLDIVLAEFRRGIAHHRYQGASEERIRQILSASIRLAVQAVHDPKLCVWLCDEFNKAARVAPIVNSHPLSQTLH